jgi:bifunctional non-homologous end joining protein LigD
MNRDPLDRYRRMRDFPGTPEPSGRTRTRRPRRLQFYIQKHDARTLHYDFRLELDGVLRSWAVPKGPSQAPGDKRLAVEVEDHPLEYGRFEGRIPKGHYGAGTVEVWDRGTWIPEGDPRRGLDRGRLTFRLDGKHLRGVWSLVRMRPDANGKKVHWLLIRSRKDQLKKAPPRESPESPKAEEFIRPELATLASTAPRGKQWIHELKFDGYRILAYVDGGEVRLRTRTGLDWTKRFGAVRNALAMLRLPDAILDGELVALDENGISNFGALQKALSTGSIGGILYYLFDLLRYQGEDVRELPLLERKNRLAKALRGARKGGTIRYTDHVRGSGESVQREACRLGLEGIVSKEANSPYRSGRSQDWMKVKCVKEQEFVIGGYTDPQGTREALGSLLLGYHGKDGNLVYAGRVGTGFDTFLLRHLRTQINPLKRTTSPYQEGPRASERRGVHWIEPKLVAQIRFTGWTEDRRLRHPVFQGLREDLPAGKVVREIPRMGPSPTSTSQVVGIAISHPERIVYPEQHLTKLDVVQYYERVAHRLLPFVAERPLSLLRCPHGRTGTCFYQKNWSLSGDAVRTVKISGKSGTTAAPVISDVRGLVSLIQQGALEIHPWGSRSRSLETPDVCIFDLDPDPAVSWPDLAAAARFLRERLQGLDLESFLKTTGGKGLHLVIPLTGAIRWEGLKTFAQKVASEMAREDPGRYTENLSKKSRRGRIFVDWMRNVRGATAVAPYSTRARAHAPVATPLAWEELDRIDRPDTFTLKTVNPRLDVDPWKGYFQMRQKLPAK